MLNFLWWFLVGPLVGWVAGRLMRTRQAWWLDAIAGLVGAILAGTACELLGLDFSSTEIGAVLVAAAGALIVTFVFRKVAGEKLATLPKRSSTRSSYTSYKSRIGK